MRSPVEVGRAVGIALAVTALAFVLRVMFDPLLGDEFPYIFFFIAAIVSAWFGGFAAGVLSSVLAGILVIYRYSEPAGSWSISEPADQVAMVLFVLIASVMGLITANLRNVADRHREAAARASQREEEYRSFFELSAVGAAEHVPPDGRFSRVNRKLVEMTGYSEEELLGMSLSSLTHSEDRAVDMQAYRKLLSGEVSFNELEKRYLRKDGSFFWVISNRTAIRDANGKLVRTVAVIQDVTSRHRAEEAQRFLISASTILGSSLDPEETLSAIGDLCVGWLCQWCTIIMVEPDGSLRRAAVAHRDPSKRLLVRELTDKFPPTRDAQREIVHVVETGQSILRNEIPSEVQKTIAATPELQTILDQLGVGPYMAVPLTSRGRTFGALSLVAAPGRKFDDTDLAVARELGLRAALAIDNATLFRASELANRSKDEFFATVSHELKTPMTTILGWSQMLRSERLDEATSRTALESIYRSAQAQAKIIDDILDVARISTGKLTLESAPLDLPGLLDAVTYAMQPAAAAKNIHLRYDNETTASTVVIGDATRLQQVFVNLLSNAIKFTPESGSVSMVLRRLDGNAEVTVSDDGIGIASEVLPHVFEPFRQGQASFTSGLGLGLAIAQRLVLGHGGRIEAHSDGPGKGARFRVTLPVATEQSSS